MAKRHEREDEDLKQQLVQYQRQQVNILSVVNQYGQRFVQARALLEEVGTTEPTYHDATSEVRHCLFCTRGAYQDHDPDCLWERILAFLAEHPKEHP